MLACKQGLQGAFSEWELARVLGRTDIHVTQGSLSLSARSRRSTFHLRFFLKMGRKYDLRCHPCSQQRNPGMEALLPFAHDQDQNGPSCRRIFACHSALPAKKDVQRV